MTDLTIRDGDVADWWRTSIIEMAPGMIKFRGRPIQDLIGTVTFPQMIWLMLRGEMPEPAQARLLEATLVAAVDHGPQAPSIAAARMAATCGVGLNNALATGVNMLGDVHGGAGQQALELFAAAKRFQDEGAKREVAVERAIADFRAAGGKFLPGFGHRFHKPVDPRTPRLLALVAEAVAAGVVGGDFAAIARSVEGQIARERGKPVPMNVDGATGVVLGELGFPPPLARAVFCISRSVGLLAHAWEQTEQGGRNKGPTPPGYLWTYEGD